MTWGPVTDYLPHRPPMLLIEELVELSGERAVCRATLRPDCVFAVDGVVHPSAMIELVAQACAVLAGATGGGAPRVALIVACREVDFAVDSFAVGDALTVTATRETSQPPLAVFTGTVVRDGAACVTMTLSVADAAAVTPGGDA